MRWLVVSTLVIVIGCGSSGESEPGVPFSPPTSGAMSPSGTGSEGTSGAEPTGDEAEATAPATPDGSGSEDPNAGVTGGLDGSEGAAPGGSSAAASGDPASEPPAEQPAPETPVAPALPTTLSTVSTGCGNTNAAGGEFSIALNGADAAFTITLPPGYDPAIPTPLIFAFHGRNQTHIQLRTQDAANIQTELGGRAIMAYLKSQAGPGWNFAAEVEPNVAFFNAVYTRALADYCVDTARIFAVGHSSGGYFANILGCRYGDVLRGIGPVAGNTQEFDCVGRVAALVVHGVRDSVVSFAGGQRSRDTYLTTNGCSMQSSAGAVAPCIEYQGCAEGLPVAWCEHDEPTYQNTNHGWPSFASRALGEFFFALGPKGAPAP